MLDIKNLSASIEGRKILEKFNLKIKPGEVHAIMGPNGSGKSTLANILSGKKGYEISGIVNYQNNNLFELDIDVNHVIQGYNSVKILLDYHHKDMTAQRVLNSVEFKINYEEPHIPVGGQM